MTKSTDKDKNKKDKGGKSSSSKRKEILKKENEEKSDEKTPPRGKKRPKIPKNRVRVQIAEERGDEDDEEQEGETGEEICSDEEIQVNGRCLVKNVPLGGECLLPEQCSNEAKCLRHKCRCPRGMGGFRNHCYSMSFI